MILAQLWLYGARKSTPYDKWLEAGLGIDQSNPLAAVHNYAERIVYNHELPSTLKSLNENKQIDIDAMIKTTKLPSDRIWVEYTIPAYAYKDMLEQVKVGMYFAQMADGRVQCISVNAMKVGNPLEWRCGITHAFEFDQWPPLMVNGAIQCGIRYAYKGVKDFLDHKNDQSEFRHQLEECIFGIFLITQPRTYSDEVVQQTDKHNRTRIKDGKPPLINYRRVTIRIGKQSKHYTHKPSSTDAPSLASDLERGNINNEPTRRAYHRVMGHFRHYTKTDNPHTTWVEPHFRGDPALGVLLHEREVRR